MRKQVLLSLVTLGLVACPKPKTENPTPTSTPATVKKVEKPVIPSAPSAPGRRTDFTLLSTSRAPEGFTSLSLTDNNLGTSWISREEEGSPIKIEFSLPDDNVCIKKIGFVTGVFGNPSVAKQVTSPTKFKITHTQKGAKGKKAAPKTEATAEITPVEGSTEIQWLEVPETCQVTRTTITITAPPSDGPDSIAIAEFYIE
jgi:hypothetical protein